MVQFYDVLKNNSLFKDFSDSELETILYCLSARIKNYKKNQIICSEDFGINEIGIVVDGVVFITKTDYNGNRTILHEIKKGESFGESLAFESEKSSPVTVISNKLSTVVFLSASKILDGCGKNCPHVDNLKKNLIRLLAKKIFVLQIKNDILSRKTIRDKLLLYFEFESKTAHSKSFRILFTRAELADFLSLNVSAMSRELGKMRDEGILTFRKNRFVLKNIKE